MVALFWYVSFAHLMGDYPLQTAGLLRIKHTFRGLALHVAVHLALLLLLAGPALDVVWPYTLLLAAIHMAIDAGKNWLNEWRTEWRIAGYLLDQVVHLSSLILVSYLASLAGPGPTLLPSFWLLLGVGFLSATHVWTITERFIMPRLAAGPEARHRWRPAVRGLIFVALVMLGRSAGLTPVMLLVVPGLPYRTMPAGRLALLTDLAVPLLAGTVVLLAPH